MKPTRSSSHVFSVFAPVLVIFMALPGVTTNAMAKSNSELIDPITTAFQVDTELLGLNHQTHDNGNYHRYHVDNTKKHMQSPPSRDQTENRIGGRDQNIAGRKYSGSRSGYRFRRYDHHTLELGIYDNGYYSQFGSRHHNRKFLNTLIGGSILYHLLK